MTPAILVIGDCAIDQYMDVDDSAVLTEPSSQEQRICFLHGSKVPVLKFKNNLAGNACHVSIACSRLGLKAQVYTELGDDENGAKFVQKFKEENVDTKFCNLNKDANTNVHTIIWHAGDRTIFSYHEPRTYTLPFNKLDAPDWIYYTSLAAGFEDFQSELVQFLKDNPETALAFNPGSFQMKAGRDKLIEMLSLTSILFVNKEEAAILTNASEQETSDLQTLHQKLHSLGVKLSVITDGSKGSSTYDGTTLLTMPAKKPKEIIDKTGAGDSYAAGFISAIYHKKSIEEAMRWGTNNATNVMEHVGCLDGLLTLEEMEMAVA